MLLGACGSGNSTSTEANSASESPSPSSLPSEPAGREWATVADASGLTFSLPKQVKPLATTQPAPDGHPLQLRVYQTQEDEVGVTVTVADGKDFSHYDARAVYKQMAQRLAESGAKNVDLSDLRPVSADSGEGTGATLSFQATDGSMNYWRMATLTDGSALVNVQALTFVPELDASTRAPVNDTFDQLVESLQFP